MKNLVAFVGVVLSVSVGFGQSTVTDLQGNVKVGATNKQRMMEDIFDAQDRKKAEWVKSIPLREFTLPKSKLSGKFTGKFIEIAGGKATVIRKDGEVFQVLMSQFSTKDQEWMREEVRLRKGLKPKTDPKKVVAVKPEAKSSTKTTKPEANVDSESETTEPEPTAKKVEAKTPAKKVETEKSKIKTETKTPAKSSGKS